MKTTLPNLSIPKDVLAELPVLHYSGKIVIVDREDDVEEAVSVLTRSGVIGFDTETRPSFRKGRVFKPALLQLSTDDTAYLFRLNKIGVHRALIDLLVNPDVLKIGLSIHDDFSSLHRCTEVEPQGFVELQRFVKNYRIADISLQKIYAIIFGERISKAQRLTNWEADELTAPQQAYAALDAWACLKIYRHLLNGGFDPEASPYVLTPEQALEYSKTHQAQ